MGRRLQEKTVWTQEKSLEVPWRWQKWTCHWNGTQKVPQRQDTDSPWSSPQENQFPPRVQPFQPLQSKSFLDRSMIHACVISVQKRTSHIFEEPNCLHSENPTKSEARYRFVIIVPLSVPFLFAVG